MENDGYSLDDKRNNVAGSDLQDIVSSFKVRISSPSGEVSEGRRGKHFFVPKTEIEDNAYDLSFSKYKEEVYEEVIYEKLDVIIGKLESIESGLSKGLAELKGLI
jgi:type I restriction enzyme M protein